MKTLKKKMPLYCASPDPIHPKFDHDLVPLIIINIVIIIVGSVKFAVIEPNSFHECIYNYSNKNVVSVIIANQSLITYQYKF